MNVMESQTKNQFKLKLLNGPLAGRELNLQFGEFSIGEQDSDLAIPLENGVNAKLLVTQEGIELVNPVPCWVDGRRWGPQGLFPLCKAIDLAGLGIVLSEADYVFPNFKLPPRKLTHLRFAVACVMAFIFVLGFVGIVASFWPSPNLKSKVHTFDPKEWVQNQLRAPALRHLKATWDDASVLTLSGICQNTKEMAVFRVALSEHGILFRDQSVCEDDLVRSANAILSLNGYDRASARAGSSPGALIISGAIHVDGRWEETVRQLKALPGLTEWTLKNNTSTLIPELVELLRKQNLLMGISLTWQGSTLLVSGIVDGSREAAIRSVTTRFCATYGVPTSFQNMGLGVDLSSLLPAPVVSLSGDPESLFLTLSNGIRLQTGSKLPNGYEITSIDESGVALLKSDQLLYVPID